MTRGHCHDDLATSRAACPRFITGINADPEGVVDRLRPKVELDPEDDAKILVSA